MGVTNSWIANYQDKPSPCISQSINDTGGATAGLGPINTCWMWLLIGAVVVAVIGSDKNKR